MAEEFVAACHRQIRFLKAGILIAQRTKVLGSSEEGRVSEMEIAPVTQPRAESLQRGFLYAPPEDGWGPDEANDSDGEWKPE